LHAAVDPRLSSFRASMHRKSGACWDAFHGRSASCFPRARLASFVRQAVIPPTSLRRDWASNQARQRHRDWLPSLSLLSDLADQTVRIQRVYLLQRERLEHLGELIRHLWADQARLAQAGGVVGCRHCEKAHLDAAIVCSNGLSRERNGAHLLARSRHGFDDGSSAGRRVNMRPC
jgi:hypothetical protein